MLSDILKNKKCFKLVCGAGNEDAVEVEKLVMLYSKAGCNFFDLSAKPEIVEAAKQGLNRAGIKKDRYLCVSVGIKGDPHVSKAAIDTNSCLKCGKCHNVCPQNAVLENPKEYSINLKRCIGCGKCETICPEQSIRMNCEQVDLKQVLPPLIKMGIDCIELHVLGEDEIEVNQKWEEVNNCYDGLLSICVDRLKLGNEKLLERVNRMIEKRKPYSTIIQADGSPMSGAEDDFKTTLQAVATAELFQDKNLPVYLLLSGGTNSKTSELAKMCDIDFNGVAIGSYARKIVKDFIKREDFFDNEEVFSQALEVAKSLVDTSFKYM